MRPSSAPQTSDTHHPSRGTLNENNGTISPLLLATADEVIEYAKSDVASSPIASIRGNAALQSLSGRSGRSRAHTTGGVLLLGFAWERAQDIIDAVQRSQAVCTERRVAPRH